MPAAPLKTFIIYARADDGLKNELLTQLRPLVRNGLLVLWHEGNILPGEDWETSVLKELALSDLVLMLVSTHSINSDFINDRQLAISMERLGQGELKAFVPIIARYCLWKEDVRISRFKALPYMSAEGVVPVTDRRWNDGEAWAVVGSALAELAKELLNVKNVEQTNNLQPKETSRYKFHPEHQYTCDRNEQFQPFLNLLNNAARPRRHFFYIFGGEAQAHRGIFRRCVNRLKGIERTTGFQVFDFAIPVPCLEDVQCLEVELPHIILTELEIMDAEMEKMAEKTLAFGLAKSPSLSKLDANGKVFFHFSITEALWNAGIVPSLTRNFIQNFCLKNLPDDAPELFFFFSIEYDDNNQSLREEIAVALKDAEFLKNLGELKMVRDEHIEQWFQTHKIHWETVEERKAMKTRFFGEKSPEMFMDTVQTKLKKVINEINNEDIHGKRN